MGSIEVRISPSAESAGPVSVTQNTTVIQVQGIFLEGEGIVFIFAPSLVEASKGNPAVVCFEADFNNIFPPGIPYQVDLRLEIIDIETSKLQGQCQVLSSGGCIRGRPFPQNHSSNELHA